MRGATVAAKQIQIKKVQADSTLALAIKEALHPKLYV